jgi:hypothetical protein
MDKIDYIIYWFLTVLFIVTGAGVSLVDLWLGVLLGALSLFPILEILIYKYKLFG